MLNVRDDPAQGLHWLGLAAFTSMCSMRVCDAMLPVLAHDFSSSNAAAAATVSMFGLCYGLMQLVVGGLGDRVGKSTIVKFAALACGLSCVGAALALSLPALVVWRGGMGGAAAGIIPLVMAWVGDRVEASSRQIVLARLLSFTVCGLMAGAWLGGWLAEALSWRVAFGLLAVLFFCSAWGVHRGLAHEPARQPLAGSPSQVLLGLLRSQRARRLYGVTLCEGALVFGVITFVPSLLHRQFGLSLSSAGAVLALFGVGGLFYSRLARHIVRRLSTNQMLLIGALLVAASFLTLAHLPSWTVAMPACLIAGLGFYLFHATLQTLATQLSEASKGAAVSMFACTLFVGQSCGVSLMGWLFKQQVLVEAMSLAAALMAALAYFSRASLRSTGQVRP